MWGSQTCLLEPRGSDISNCTLTKQSYSHKSQSSSCLLQQHSSGVSWNKRSWTVKPSFVHQTYQLKPRAQELSWNKRSMHVTHKGYDQKLENLHFQNVQSLFHTKSCGYDLPLTGTSAKLPDMWLCDASTSASWRTNKIMWFASTSSRNETTMCIHTSSHYHGYIPEIHPFLQIFWWLDKTTETTQRQTPRHTTNMPFSFSPPASTFFCIICNIVTIF